MPVASYTSGVGPASVLAAAGVEAVLVHEELGANLGGHEGIVVAQYYPVETKSMLKPHVLSPSRKTQGLHWHLVRSHTPPSGQERGV